MRPSAARAVRTGIRAPLLRVQEAGSRPCGLPELVGRGEDREAEGDQRCEGSRQGQGAELRSQLFSN